MDANNSAVPMEGFGLTDGEHGFFRERMEEDVEQPAIERPEEEQIASVGIGSCLNGTQLDGAALNLAASATGGEKGGQASVGQQPEHQRGLPGRPFRKAQQTEQQGGQPFAALIGLGGKQASQPWE